MKKISLAFGLFLSPLLLLLIIEGLLRLIFGAPPGDFNPIMSDSIMNHKWKPNLAYQDSSRGIFPYTLYTNNQSWVEKNDISPKKPKNTVRIFYMGDSNVQGVVAEDKKMVDLVEKELNKRVANKGKTVEAINTGTSSWSPSLYYMLVTTQMMKYSPDIVVINVDMTDARDDSVYRQVTTYNEQGLPVAVHPSDDKKKADYKMTPQGVVKISESQKISDSLNRNSAVVYHFTRFYDHFSKNNTIRKLFFKSEVSTVPPIDEANWLAPKLTETGKKNAEYSMQMLGFTIDYLRQHNVKVVITGVPHYPQYTGEWSSRPHQFIKQTAEKHHALFFSSYEALKPKIGNSKQTDYYWDVDPTHFNEAGNKIWSDVQIEFLLRPGNKLL